jgi:hypothetical protein
LGTLRDIIAENRKRRIWRDPAILISLFAFVLSLLSTGYSYYIIYKKDIHDQLAELSGALRTLQELNLNLIEISDKYAGSPNEARATALLSNQIYNTTILAADIAFRIGTTATTAVIMPISQGLYHYGQFSRAAELAKIGRRAARSAEDDVTALRWLGTMKIRSGSPEGIKEGNELFSRALTFEQRYAYASSYDEASFLKASVQLQWADELARFDCEAARKHFLEGATILNSAGRSPYLEQIRRLARPKAANGLGGISNEPLTPAARPSWRSPP